MLTFAATANPAAPPPAQSAASYTPPAVQASPNQVSFNAVPASLNLVEPFNNTRPNALIERSNSVSNTSSNAGATSNTLNPLTGGPANSAGGVNSATVFLTQILGQGGRSNFQLAADLYPELRSEPVNPAFSSSADIRFSPSLANRYNRNAQINQPQAQQQAASLEQRANTAREIGQQQRQIQEVARAEQNQVQVRAAQISTVTPPANLSLGTIRSDARDSEAARSEQQNAPRDLGTENLLGSEGGVNAYMAALGRSTAYDTIAAPRFVFNG